MGNWDYFGNHLFGNLGGGTSQQQQNAWNQQAKLAWQQAGFGQNVQDVHEQIKILLQTPAVEDGATKFRYQSAVARQPTARKRKPAWTRRADGRAVDYEGNLLPEGSLCEWPTEWLDKRIDEMRVRL